MNDSKRIELLGALFGGAKFAIVAMTPSKIDAHFWYDGMSISYLAGGNNLDSGDEILLAVGAQLDLWVAERL